MRYIGYVSDIDDDVDACELDFDTTEYQAASAALVSEDRLRIEWMEGDEFWAVTINHIYENADGEFGTGMLECNYPSWEGSRKNRKT